MDSKTILEQFKQKVNEKIGLFPQGKDRYVVETPFIFEDGDNIVIFLRYDSATKKWILTDDGHTFMHMSYFMDSKDLMGGTRADIIENSQKMFNVSYNEGELSLFVEDDNFGDALYDFIQCLLKITDLTFTERRRVERIFFEDFNRSMKQLADEKRISLTLDYFSPADKKHEYPVNAYMKIDSKQLMIFAISNTNRCKDAIISIYALRYEQQLKFHAIGVFEDQKDIGRKVLAQFSNVAQQQITDLGQMKKLDEYIDLITTV